MDRELPDFGSAVWNSPDRHRPFNLRFHAFSTADFGRYREIAGTLTHEGRTYSVMVRTHQPIDSIQAILGIARGVVWMQNGRAEGWTGGSDAGDIYQPVTAWVQAEEPGT